MDFGFHRKIWKLGTLIFVLKLILKSYGMCTLPRGIPGQNRKGSEKSKCQTDFSWISHKGRNLCKKSANLSGY